MDRAQRRSVNMSKKSPRDVGADLYKPTQTKRIKLKPTSSTSPPQTSFLVLRSGPVVRHPLLFEAGTIQVESMSKFELSPLDPCEPCFDANGMPVTTILPLASTVTPGTSVDTTPPADYEPLSPGMPATPSSQASIRTTQSTTSSEGAEATAVSACFASPLQPGSSHVKDPTSAVASAERISAQLLIERASGSRVPVDDPRLRGYDIPSWFEEVCESDGYDTESIGLVLGCPKRPVKGAKTHEDAASAPTGARSSVGFPEGWSFAAWSADVRVLHDQFNPSHWSFPPVSVGGREGAGCACERRCNASNCLNARENRFCTAENCVFEAMCGNALREHDALVIAQNLRTGLRGVMASKRIPAGEIIGEYIGHMQLLGPPCLNGPANEGYRMHLKTRTTGRKHVGIDALEAGGKLRFLNHVCDPSARFHEVQTGRRLTVVAVTVRDVLRGEEVTVSYGDRLWFICRCGWSGCQHRDIQHLPDAPGKHAAGS